jgi:hypothetical protein
VDRDLYEQECKTIGWCERRLKIQASLRERIANQLTGARRGGNVQLIREREGQVAELDDELRALRGMKAAAELRADIMTGKKKPTPAPAPPHPEPKPIPPPGPTHRPAPALVREAGTGRLIKHLMEYV